MTGNGARDIRSVDAVAYCGIRSLGHRSINKVGANISPKRLHERSLHTSRAHGSRNCRSVRGRLSGVDRINRPFL